MRRAFESCPERAPRQPCTESSVNRHLVKKRCSLESISSSSPLGEETEVHRPHSSAAAVCDWCSGVSENGYRLHGPTGFEFMHDRHCGAYAEA
jgi:hypothetical protein